MKMYTSLIDGKPPSVEKGQMRYQFTNDYVVLHQSNRKTKCTGFFKVLQVVLYIELIVFVGWLGCLTFSQYKSYQANNAVEFYPESGCDESECSILGIKDERNIENTKIRIENHREIRSIGDSQNFHEECERSVHMMRERVDSVASRFVPGEASDPIVTKLRQKFIHMMISLTMRLIFVQSNDTANANGPTDEQWQALTLGINREILKSADSEHQIRLAESGPPSPEITNEIRDIVESMARNHMNCETVLPTPKLANSRGTTQQALRLFEVIIEREKCADSWNNTQERIRRLEAQMVPGESSDPIITNLRQETGKMLISIPQALALFIQDDAKTKAALDNITNEHWHAVLADIKEEVINITDLQHRQNLEKHGPPTQYMADELRAIVEYYLIDHRKCNRMMEIMRSAGKFGRNGQEIHRRMGRATGSMEYLAIDCHGEESQLLEERLARLKAIAEEDVTSDPSVMKTKTFLNGIEEALNSTNPAKVYLDDDLLHNDSGLIVWREFVSNASLELKKEFYELVRDEFLELRKQKNPTAEWDGYDLIKVYENFTHAVDIPSENVTANDVLNIIIKCGEAFNLHYLKNEGSNSWDDTEISSFGILTYLDEEPEKLGVRHMRHILNGYIRLYFRVLNLLGSCKSPEEENSNRVIERGKRGTERIIDDELQILNQGSLKQGRHYRRKRVVEAEPKPKPIPVICWSTGRDAEFLEERRARLEAFANENATGRVNNSYTQNYMKAIETALNATSLAEIHFDDELIVSSPLSFVQQLLQNTTLELHKEGYEFLRDLHLEMLELKNESPEWEGYNVDMIANNISGEVIFSFINATPVTIFNDFVRFGKIFNLRYDELQSRNEENDPAEPVFGKFIYLGEEPEKLGVQHLRHILDDFVKFFFRVQHPAQSEICDWGKETQAKD